MIEFEDKEDSFEFEKYICFEKPELWRNEAHGLFASARVLLEFSEIHDGDAFEKEEKLKTFFSSEITDRFYWYHRIIRMLWGYGFENILKGIIIKELKSNNPNFNSVPLDQIRTHNLLYLFKESGITLNSDQEFYIKIVQKCSIWMGRYPLPTKSDQMYEKRKALNSSEELLRRSILLREQWQNGEIDRVHCESDILHGGIGNQEIDVISKLIKIAKSKFDE